MTTPKSSDHSDEAEDMATIAAVSSTSSKGATRKDIHEFFTNSKKRHELLNNEGSLSDLMIIENGVRIASFVAVVTWFVLLLSVMTVTPGKYFVILTAVERKSSMLASICIGISMLTRVVPLIYVAQSKEVKKARSSSNSPYGVLLGCVIVQTIALLTDLAMAILPTPVIIDPITGARVFLLRWCEWTPLAFLMTFMTEILGTSEQGITIAAWRLGILQGTSTICGLFFPFCQSYNWWMFWMIISFLTFLPIFPRCYDKYIRFKNAGKLLNGSTTNQGEYFDRCKSAFYLMLSCTITWSILVLFYFVSWMAPLYSPPESILSSPSTPMIVECFLDVMAKVFYLVIIAEIHTHIFDDEVRSERRLKEMRSMMNAVWESSSDVIAITIKDTFSQRVTTMLSPTYKRLFDYNKKLGADRISSRKTANPNSESKEDSESVVVFDLDTDDFANYDEAIKRYGLTNEFSLEGYHCTPKVSHLETPGHVAEKSSSAPFIDRSELVSIGDLIVKAWYSTDNIENSTIASATNQHLILTHDIHRSKDGINLHFEANITIIEKGTCLIIVMRDITERVMRFEAEKRIVSESTARLKDAEANRFTKHEVKNGLLTAIELCTTLKNAYHFQQRHKFSSELGTSSVPLQPILDSNNDDEEIEILTHQNNIDIPEYFQDLQYTLNDILDTILSEALARDVIHEVYQPKKDKVDIRQLLCTRRDKNFKSDQDQQQSSRFPFITFPSPLPPFVFDAQLLKHIHQNAVSNACKYGKTNGVVLTQIHYDADNHDLEMSVINLPGKNHAKLVLLSDQEANEKVFSQGTRLSFGDSIHKDVHSSHSSGDGAWIIYKCAKTLNGKCSIKFDENRTIFKFRCPITPFHQIESKANAPLMLNRRGVGKNNESGNQNNVKKKQFKVSTDTWGIVIDDSKMQRKVLERLLSFIGIKSPKSRILGKDENEILTFIDVVIEIVRKDENANCLFLLVVDENLEMPSEGRCISGSLLVQQILQKLSESEEKRILSLIRSANDSSEDVSLYRERAHDYLPKTAMNREKFLDLFIPIWTNRFPNSLDNSRDVKEDEANFSQLQNYSLSSSANEALKQTIQIIDALVTTDDQADGNSIIQKRWPIIKSKLHLLKGDLMSFTSFKDDSSLKRAISEIERLRGMSVPDGFVPKWRDICTLIFNGMNSSVEVISGDA